MGVDDQGMQAIAKSAEQVTSGDRSNYYIKTSNNFLREKLGNNIQVAYPTSTTETYTFRQNTTTIYVLTITYTDATKENILSVERTS